MSGGFWVVVLLVLNVDGRLHGFNESRMDPTRDRRSIELEIQKWWADNRPDFDPLLAELRAPDLAAEVVHAMKNRDYESEFMDFRRRHDPTWTAEDQQEAEKNVTQIEHPDVSDPLNLQITCPEAQRWLCGPESQPAMKRMAWDYASASDCFKCPVNKCCLEHDKCWSHVKTIGNFEADYSTCDDQFESCVSDAYREDEACQKWLLYFPQLVKKFGADLRHWG